MDRIVGSVYDRFRRLRKVAKTPVIPVPKRTRDIGSGVVVATDGVGSWLPDPEPVLPDLTMILLKLIDLKTADKTTGFLLCLD